MKMTSDIVLNCTREHEKIVAQIHFIRRFLDALKILVPLKIIIGHCTIKSRFLICLPLVLTLFVEILTKPLAISYTHCIIVSDAYKYNQVFQLFPKPYIAY